MVTKKKGDGNNLQQPATTCNNLQNFKKRCRNNLQQPSKFKKIYKKIEKLKNI